MANNEVLRIIKDALKIDDAAMITAFKLSEREVGQSTITALLKTEDEDGYIPCSDPILGFFLDGLIMLKRGKQEGKPSPTGKPAVPLTNNAILKKLRIALELQEDEMLEILILAGSDISKHELTALFRKEGHKHYNECSPQFLRSFLKGLALHYDTALNNLKGDSENVKNPSAHTRG